MAVSRSPAAPTAYFSITAVLGCIARSSPLTAGATTNAVIWQSGVRRLTGLFLPSLRTFTLQAPEVAEYQLALTTRTLYLLAPEGKVWATAAPKP